VPEPSITAFYGFKGGTGRSFLLASCAAALAALGRRVLVMDWDLEAPGVGDLFDASGNDVWIDWRRRPGTLDLLLNRAFPPYADASHSQADHNRRLHELLFDDADRRPEDRYLVDVVQSRAERPGRLSLVGPGRHRSATQYFDRLLDVDWTWYFENNGSAFLAMLRDVLKAQQHFDHILIDGRTGYSPSSISAIRYLADHVCVVGTYSFQSIDGIARVWPLLQAAQGGAELRRRLVLARKPKVSDPRQIADFEGKQQLLEEYGIPAANRLELPIVGNLHGGDGHLWTRYELFAQLTSGDSQASAAADATPPRDGVGGETASLVEYLKGLARLLQEVIGVESVNDPASPGIHADVPLLWVPNWWKAVSDNRFWSKEYNLTTVSWAQQIEDVDSALGAITHYLANPTDRAQQPPSVAPSGQNQENSIAEDFEPWAVPGEQTHKSLPSRALLAVRANEALHNTGRPLDVSETTWLERITSIRLHYGVDVAPTSTDPIDLSRGEGERGDTPDAIQEKAARVDRPSPEVSAWNVMAVNISWGVGEWFSEDVRKRLAQSLEHAVLGGEKKLGLAELKELLELRTLAGFVLKNAKKLNQSAGPLTDETLRRWSETILETCWKSARGVSLESLQPGEVIRIQRSMLEAVEDVAAGKTQDKESWLRKTIDELADVFPANRLRETSADKINAWSERVLRAGTRFLLPQSRERVAAASEIERVVRESAAFLADVDADSPDAKVAMSATDLWELLSARCRRYKTTITALPLLLSAIRLTKGTVPSLVENLEICLLDMASPGAHRPSEEYAKRIRADSSETGTDRGSTGSWRYRSALRREWWKFGYGYSVQDGDSGERYGSYRELVTGLEAWIDQAKSEDGAVIVDARISAEAFRQTFLVEFGDSPALSVLDEKSGLWPWLQRVRLLIAQGRYRDAEEKAGVALRQEPLDLEPKDPDASLLGRLHLAKALAAVLGGERTPSLCLDSARKGMALIRGHAHGRSYPFDRTFERMLKPMERRRSSSVGELEGLASGEERPAPYREELAKIQIEYAEVCLRCGDTEEASQAVADALSLLDIDDDGPVPTRGFTGPLSHRMALTCSLALALKAKITKHRLRSDAAMKAALTWARWDCAPEQHGSGRKVYYRRVLAWCASGSRRRAEIEAWLRDEATIPT
jgi:hypothetical protein